jgi:hypothetical protein
MLLEKQGRDKEDDVVEAPKKLDPSKWVDSYLAFLNFLRGQVSADGKRTLDHVVRKVPPVGWAPTSREASFEIQRTAGRTFLCQDNRKVYMVTKQWTNSRITLGCKLGTLESVGEKIGSGRK